MMHVAPLRYDIIFKKAFGQPEVFTAFANDFLGIHLEIDKVTQEKAFDSNCSKTVGNLAKIFSKPCDIGYRSLRKVRLANTF